MMHYGHSLKEYSELNINAKFGIILNESIDLNQKKRPKSLFSVYIFKFL